MLSVKTKYLSVSHGAKMNNKPMWFVALRNTYSDKVTVFWDWGDNADEVIKNIIDNFFDQKTDQLTISEKHKEEYDLGIDKTFQNTELEAKYVRAEETNKIPFPSTGMELLKIVQVKDKDEWDKLAKEYQ